jgi:hypothetical protein
MSLRNRARSLQQKTGLSYQQALDRLRVLGEKPAKLSRQTGWPLDVCDRFLVDGHAPIQVVEIALAPGTDVLIVQACEKLRNQANARAVLLWSWQKGILVHLGEDVERLVMMRAMLPTGNVVPRLPQEEQIWEVGNGLSLVIMKVGRRAMLVVKLHQDETSLGLVRLRMRQACEELQRLLADAETTPGVPPVGGSGGPGGIPAEVRVFEETRDPPPEPRPKPIGRKKKR